MLLNCLSMAVDEREVDDGVSVQSVACVYLKEREEEFEPGKSFSPSGPKAGPVKYTG
jgi:hypothetical protein